ncbi:hypothetical protein TrVE_jg31 [Triparma verrucosa]|uniref:Uncharacterized protein n=1 Tax=Triparma verrucosa TaxID=1606542 RepID=A0A9W7KY84_9STRA|nr:hypothetical protein TrVE_jg31 [Triparma verrucosa]
MRRLVSTKHVEPLLSALHLSGRTTPSNLVISQPKFTACITGGGGNFFRWMLAKPGASSTLLEGIVPYDKHSCLKFLESNGESSEGIGFCSKEMAARLAVCSHRRSLELTPLIVQWPDLYGVSATATIISHYKRRGDYRVHVGVAGSAGDVKTLCFTFGKGYRNRDGEDSGVAFMALRALYEAITKKSVPEICNDWIVSEVEPEETVKNDVGEIASGLEVIPELSPFISSGSGNGSDSWSVQVLMGKNQVKNILAPGSKTKLPADAIVAIPSEGFDLRASHKVALDSLGLGRNGPMGKSWTQHQPPTLILKNGHEPEDIFDSTAFFNPDTKVEEQGEDGVEHVLENWGLLAPPVDAGGSSLGCLFQYKDSGAKFLVDASTFGDISRNVDLLLSSVRAGCTFIVDCGQEECITDVMRGLEENTRVREFFEIANATTLINGKVEDVTESFDDGSPSTVGVQSKLVGDSSTDGYVVVEWDNGITFRGFLEGRKFHGHGTKLYSKGGGYFGSWRNNKREGFGVSVYGGKWGYDRWEGHFVEDKAEGAGQMFGCEGDMIEGFAFVGGEPVKK